MLAHERIHLIGVRDIGFEEFVAVAVLLRDAFEIGQIPRVGQHIHVTD